MKVKRNMLLKKISVLLLFLTVLISMSGFKAIAGYNNDISYKFTIKSGQAISTTSSRYRSTTDPTNSWKVKMLNSTEGAGTIIRYRLFNDASTGVSNYYEIKQGDPAVYKPAYTSASKTNVRLAGWNNNNVTKTYEVNGIWDEETGVRV